MSPRSERDYREAPPTGYVDWPNNGEIHERLRCGLLKQADDALEAGDVAVADDLTERASYQKRERDRYYREHERRLLNRRLRRGGY